MKDDKPKKKPARKTAPLPNPSRAAGQKSGANPSSGARTPIRPPPPRRAGR